MNETAIERPSVRVLLIDENDRVLLFCHAIPAGDSLAQNDAGLLEPLAAEMNLWVPPGGGLEAGETHAAAATRELWEETGLRDAAIGPCVWLRDVVFRWSDQLWRAREQYHVCRVGSFEVDVSNQEAHERIEMTAHRWWSLDEIEASSEAFVPSELGRLLRPILRGELPASPITVGV